MFYTKSRLFFFLFLSVGYFSFTLSAQTKTDYKNWSLSELLFSINSDLLSSVDKEIYLEYYLQKAKKEKASEDVIIGYRKKILLAKNYETQKQYADSLLHFTQQLKNIQAIGSAYNVKGYVEYLNKDYKKALEYNLNAEEYLKQSEDEYTLNKVKSSIGSMYYHLEEYDKSEKATKEALLYYQSQLKDTSNAYNNLRGYITNLFSLSKTIFRQQKNDTIKLLIKEGYQAIDRLTSKDKVLETAYFDLINGMYNHQLKQYRVSDSLLNKALTPIQNNRDFANEHLLYLYLGKNAWETNRKDQALLYFEKIEHLYQVKKFANVELSEAFNYLITYYQDKKDLEKELYYTKLLMTLSSKLHKSNTKLSSYMHTHLDTKKLEASQQKLEQELAQSKFQLYGLILVSLLIICLTFIYFKRKTRSKQVILPKVPLDFLSVSQAKNTDSLFVKVPESNHLSSTTQILNKKLEDFENKKGFLQKITQVELARQLGTNRHTLSKFFHEEKNVNFPDYLKQLRIQHALYELTYNPKMRLLNLTGLASEFGFGSAKGFSAAFKEITKISVTDFIKMRQQDEDFKEMDQSKTAH
ncbi:helix-turn-helix domain-containing protein [Myroides odoratus]|nr:helix-turn-helix domain-containing protein [Myroides odoratus]QQU03312.1 AraC family transcriptional regulator [Myroides odoratus]